MAVNLLIKNIPSQWLSGMVVAAFPEGHQFGRLESKTVFEQKKSQFMLENDPRYLEEFPREYVIVKFIDKNINDVEVQELLTPEGAQFPVKRFKPVDDRSPFYQPLLNDAYVEVNYAEALPLIEDVV
ncbi:hypothetical protein Q4489_04325 [Thalassotalea sp. 1_MG-2023]|uniref:hypothetical protein n=1 Tax=Thalassotalea sp. 1_MG-2023 TaxID=3062680 RepID=UPI0026E181C3|nr:hypothetical protein [Thalassotalea sp. 1_MG-2023]MDO6426223.1 hypothetical protein [Thalassotalea sp. 1_MG-2023]